MARSEAQRQKKLMKKRQKDMLRRKRQFETIPYTLMGTKQKIRMARQYPLYECLINPSWKDKGLAVILLTRRQPDGCLLFGVYLVDVLCLGLKNTFCNADFPMYRYGTDLIGKVYRDEDPVPCPSDLAHHIIYGAITFAEQYGFRPHRDFELSQYVLDDAGSLRPGGDIEFGRDGKPLFIAGPDDNVPRILRQLESTAGTGHFDFLYGSKSPVPMLPDYPGQTGREAGVNTKYIRQTDEDRPDQDGGGDRVYEKVAGHPKQPCC